DSQTALDCLEVRELRDELGVGIAPRIAAVDALRPVLGHKDRAAADPQRAKRCCGVGGEVRIPGAGSEEDGAPLLALAAGAGAAVVARTHQRLAGQLQEDSAEHGMCLRSGDCDFFGVNGHALSSNRSNSSTSAPSSASAWPTFFDESWIQS